jgi:DNA-binding LacI/PurR family transcriptional regulator
MLGVIAASRELFGPGSTHRAVEDAARDAGYVATSVSLSETTREALAAATEHLARVGVEGIVVIAGHDAALDVVRSHSSSLPFVIIEGDLSSAALTVGVNQAMGARLATEHLLALGHRNIAHVSGPGDWAEARARAQGWRTAIIDAGVRGIEFSGDWSAASGYSAGLRIAEEGQATAVFAANDQMAIGVLRALYQCLRRVPERTSVVGFDDIPEAAYLTTPLTTVRQDFAGVGRRAVGVVTLAITGESIVSSRLLEPTLVVRETTGPVADRNN